MSRNKFVKIVKKVCFGLIVVIYLTTEGSFLWSKIVSGCNVNNFKYTVENKYEMAENEVNLLVTKNLYFVTLESEKKKFVRDKANVI